MGPSACEDTLEEDAGKAEVEEIPLSGVRGDQEQRGYWEKLFQLRGL